MENEHLKNGSDQKRESEPVRSPLPSGFAFGMNVNTRPGIVSILLHAHYFLQPSLKVHFVCSLAPLRFEGCE